MARMNKDPEAELRELDQQITRLTQDTRAITNDVSVAFRRAAADIKELQIDNIKALAQISKESAIRTQKAEREAELQLNNLRLEHERKLTDIKIEGVNRVKKAEQSAQNEIAELQLKAAKQRSELQKQQALLSRDNWKDYAAQLKQTQTLQKRIESNNAWIEEIAKKGLDPDSKSAARLQRQQVQAERVKNTEEYAQNLIKQLPMLGVKLGETNTNAWVRALGSMVSGAHVGSDGMRHNIGSDIKSANAARQARASKREDLEAAAKASGNESAYLKQYETAREKLLARDKNTGKTKYELLQEEIADRKDSLSGAEANLNDLKGQRKDINKQLKRANLSDEERSELLDRRNNLNAQIKEAKNDVSTITDAINQALADSGLDQLDDTQKEMLEADNKAKNANTELAASIYSSAANTTAVLADLAESLESTMDEIASKQSAIDTRLNGSTENDQSWGSYWKAFSNDFSSLLASPLIKQEDLVSNLETAISKGISRDAEQVAMLETVKDKIATTFNAFDGTMRRLIRIQDQNTTAARLGMEASLNELLNEMYETTEYLSDLASSVRDNLTEAEALMEGDEAVEFEYQVQKWLGSLYSVGMSSSGVASIATALGQLSSGDISGISSGGASNLLIMAANNAGLSISDILADGLDSSDTNKLLSAMVDYMAELVAESGNSLVVQQQLASVYGLTASDLKAATNLTGEYAGKTGYTDALESYIGSYNSMISNLFDMANSMYSRMSYGELMSNAWSNVQYSTAAGMASNPVTYLTMKIADILDTFVGGSELPVVSVMGNSVDTKLTVSNILKSASVVGGFTSSLVSMISNAISSGGNGFTGSGLLNLVGITNTGSSVSRGASTSASGTATILNGDVDDITTSATNSANDEAEVTLVSAQEESTEVTNSTINDNIVSIYNLLQSVVDGTSSFTVKQTVDDSLTWTR